MRPLLVALLALGAHTFAQEIAIVQIASGIAGPTDIQNARDGSGRLFFVQQDGTVRILRNGVLVPQPFLDIRTKTRAVAEQGLLGLAFPPGFAQKQRFYVDYTDLSGNTVIAQYRVSTNPDIADAASETVLMNITQPFPNHKGGQLRFGRDGFLYIGMGDGGSGGDPLRNGQNPATLLGKLLRVDVDSDPGHVRIPPGNPFLNTAGARPEIWALGLRNPWRFSFDRATGDLWIADVGEGMYEEVDFQSATSPGGENYGWNVMEGPSCFLAATCSTQGLTLPLAWYSHSDGCSVIGGFVYRGTTAPSLQGTYIYGDLCSGRLWGINRGGLGVQNRLLLLSGLSITTFGEDEAGEIYVANGADGSIHRIVGLTGPPPSNQRPAASISPLSGTGTAASFSFIASDANGAADISAMYMLIGPNRSFVNACYIAFDPRTRQLWLASDPANSWLIGPIVGQPGIVQNSQCAIDASASTVSATTNTLTLTLKLTFKAGLHGPQNVYLLASDLGLLNNGWEQLASWIVPAAGNQPPTTSLSPSSGAGTSASISFVASDPNGATDIAAVYVLIGPSGSFVNACYITFDPLKRLLWLASDPANSWLGGLIVGQAGTVQNSQCAIDAGGSTVSAAGNTLILTLKLTFKSGLHGTQNIYVLAGDLGLLNSGWLQLGTWAVSAAVNPAPTVSLSPSSGTGTVASINFTASDPTGATNIDAMYVVIGSSRSVANACYIAFAPPTRQLWLASDPANSWLGAYVVGQAGTLQNSQCAIETGVSTFSAAGNTLNLTLQFTFKAAFQGTWNIYVVAHNLSMLSSGWQQLGSWAIP